MTLVNSRRLHMGNGVETKTRTIRPFVEATVGGTYGDGERAIHYIYLIGPEGPQAGPYISASAGAQIHLSENVGLTIDAGWIGTSLSTRATVSGLSSDRFVYPVEPYTTQSTDPEVRADAKKTEVNMTWNALHMTLGLRYVF
ncbi:MAG: hypothetical protein HY073_01570 [Deltaproteobacteria bacterium]|nr:hypothetical protein [Deltaproteobacteria bacterium]